MRLCHCQHWRLLRDKSIVAPRSIQRALSNSDLAAPTAGTSSHISRRPPKRRGLCIVPLEIICKAHNSMLDCPRAWRNNMPRSALMVVAAALLLGGTSLASAKNRGAAGVKPFHPAINETVPRPTLADPYSRLSDSYYGAFDPFPGLFG